MSADIHAIALVLDGAADSADKVCGLEEDGLDVGAALKLERSGESSRSGADNDGSLLHELPGPLDGSEKEYGCKKDISAAGREVDGWVKKG